MKWNVSVLRRSGECERTEVADFELSEFFNRIASAEGKAQLAEANAMVAELAGKLASLAERQQAIAATPWWRRGRMAMKLLGPGGE